MQVYNAYWSSLLKCNFYHHSDWAQAITKFLKEQLMKIMEHYQGSQTASTTSFLTAGPTAVVDIDSANKHWSYVTQLAKHLYEVWANFRACSIFGIVIVVLYSVD